MPDELREVSEIVDILKAMGYPVARDTHVHEADVCGGLDVVVADLRIILDEDIREAHNDQTDVPSLESTIREVVREELDRAAREAAATASGGGGRA